MTSQRAFNNSTMQTCFFHLAAAISLDPEDQDIETITRTFKTCLEQHDYFYSYSDDALVYNRGLQESSIIERAAREHPHLASLYQDYLKKMEGKGA